MIDYVKYIGVDNKIPSFDSDVTIGNIYKVVDLVEGEWYTIIDDAGDNQDMYADAFSHSSEQEYLTQEIRIGGDEYVTILKSEYEELKDGVYKK